MFKTSAVMVGWRVSSRRTITSLAYFLCFFCLGLVIASPGPCLAAIADRVGATLSAVSSVFVARACGYFVGTLIGGAALDLKRF